MFVMQRPVRTTVPCRRHSHLTPTGIVRHGNFRFCFNTTESMYILSMSVSSHRLRSIREEHLRGNPTTFAIPVGLFIAFYDKFSILNGTHYCSLKKAGQLFERLQRVEHHSKTDTMQFDHNTEEGMLFWSCKLCYHALHHFPLNTTCDFFTEFLVI